MLTNKEKEITNYQNSSKEMEIDSSLNRSTLSENRNNSNTGRMRFEREWSYDIKQKDDSLYGYIKNKVDTNLTKKESILRKHGYAVVSRKEDKSIINNISKPKKISTLQRLNASANSDWETRWERKWFANEFKELILHFIYFNFEILNIVLKIVETF